MVDGKKLKKIVIQILKKRGLSLSHATISANALINAEYVGAYGHGISRLKMYCERIKKKVINPKPKFKIKKISNSISFIDANNSIGFVAADTAIKTLIKNTKKTGIGLVGVKNSGHYGLSGYYVEQAVKKNLMVWCFTNAPPAIAPFGAKKTLFGTNPICFGTPSGEKVPFILFWSFLFNPFNVSIRICILSISKSEGIVISTLIVSGNLTETQEYKIDKNIIDKRNSFFISFNLYCLLI